MLRTLFVLTIAAVGGAFALRGPFPALLFYIWIAYFRPETWVWTDLVSQLQLSLLAGSYLLLRTLAAGNVVLSNWRTAALGAFFLQTLLSTLASSHMEYGWPFWTDYAKSLVVTWVIMGIVDRPSRVRIFLVVMTVSLGFEAAKQGWLQLAFNPGAKNWNTHPVLGDENGVAIGMLMLSAVVLVVAETAVSRFERYFFIFVWLGVLYRAIVTYSRGGLLAAIALGGYYVIGSKRRVQAALLIALACMIILPVLPPAFWDRMSTVTASEEERDVSAKGRIHFWHVALRMANDRPLTGVGFNSFNAAYNEYDFSGGQFGENRAVHSSWLSVASELGWIGFAIYVTVIVLAFASLRRTRRRARADDRIEPLGRYAFAMRGGLLAFLVGGTFVNFQYTELLWHFIGLSFALDLISAKEASLLAGEPGQQPTSKWPLPPPISVGG